MISPGQITHLCQLLFSSGDLCWLHGTDRERRHLLSIRNISRWEFEQLLPERSAIEATIGEQVEWWAQKAGRFIGTIAKGIAEPGWRYILLERDEGGRFRICRLRGGIESLQAASHQLVTVMETSDSPETLSPVQSNQTPREEPPCANN